MKDFLNGGKFDKFVVFKTEDVQKYTGNLSKAALNKTSELIAAGRQKEGKNPENRYLVINVDEPYAPEIVEILKRNGHWG